MKNFLSLTCISNFYENLKDIINNLQKNSHTHSNMDVLDSITSDQITGNSNTDSGWQTLTGSNGELKYRKCGKTVEIGGEYIAPLAGGGFTIGTLPEGYRPKNSKVTGIFTNESCSQLLGISVNTSGLVYIYGSTQKAFSKGQKYYPTLTFFVD